jgi:TolA-binding protein
MKATHRHRLKENEFARSMAHAQQAMAARGKDIGLLVTVVLVALALAGSYAWWQQRRNDKVTSLLAQALAVEEAPVVAPAAPAPGSPMPVQQAGTYPTEQAKLEAALPRLQEAADKYPGTDAGITARYHLAAVLAQLGRYAEAEQRYTEVIDKAGGKVYGHTARLGLADTLVAEGKYDAAIKIYQELSTDKSSQLPIDGVLMQLGRACMKAGKKTEAAHAFTRVVEEFPQSVYAADARRQMEEAKKS